MEKPRKATAGQPRLLIIDDALDSITALQGLLGDSYKLAAVRDGENGIERAAVGDVDLILLDVNMPGIDGYETCRRLKSNPLTHDVPVIFISANDSAQDEGRGFEAGGVDYISKPYSAQLVQARVQTHVTLKLQRDHLTALLMMDSLTSIPNRTAFDMRLEQEWQRAMRYQRPLGLLMIDVDRFKALNDYGGHLFGDECLRQVARALTEGHLRISDFAARYAGDEFACLLPETALDGTLIVGKRIHEVVRSIAMAELPNSKTQLPRLTISVGAASIVPTRGQTAQALIALADKHLYDAKEQGRDSVSGADAMNDVFR
jgi:diguanylate cyclase (GGDEF)-like protein